MYPNDNRYPDNMPNIDNMNPPIYGNQMRNPSMEMGINRPPYYENPYYDKPQMMQQPMYDYMNQPPIMPMNQTIDPRYQSWRQSSENRPSIMPSYYERNSIAPNYMHEKLSIPQMGYQDNFPAYQQPVTIRPSQMNLLQRISFLIKPQLPQLKKIMIKATSNLSSNQKKKQPSKRQRSRQRQRQKDRDYDRSYQKRKSHNNSTNQWVCSKCSFPNFDWREKCKKCNELKPSFPSMGKNFVAGPEDWKCSKCGNLNYARRAECNRCKQLKIHNK